MIIEQSPSPSQRDTNRVELVWVISWAELRVVAIFFELLVYLSMLWLCWCSSVFRTSSLLGLLCLLPGARLLAFGFHIHLLRRPWVVSQACIPIIVEYLPGATLSIHARTLSVALILVAAEPAAGRLLVLLERLKNLLMRVAIGHIHWTTRKSQNHMMAYMMWHAMLRLDVDRSAELCSQL